MKGMILSFLFVFCLKLIICRASENTAIKTTFVQKDIKSVNLEV